TSEDAGDFGGWNVVHFAHDEDRLLLGRENGRHGVEYVLDLLALNDDALLGVGHRLHETQIRVDGVVARLLVAHEIDRDIRDHAIQPRVERVSRIVLVEVFPQLDEDELRDVLGVFGVADDPVAETVDLGCLPADELFESLRLTIANGLNELPIIRFDRFFRGNHQPEFRGHRDISTKAASKTSTN